MLIYGEPGAGKTRLAATAAESAATSPLLFLDLEKGGLTLHDLHVDIVDDLDGLKGLNEAMRFLATPNKYRTVVFDSLTRLHQWLMEDEIRNQGGKEDYRSAYGAAQKRLVSFLLQCRSLPKHTIFTSWSKKDEDEDTGRNKIMPALPGQLAPMLPGYIDFVFHLNAEQKAGQVRRVLRTADDGRRIAKDRTHLLPGEMVDATFPQIVELAAPALAAMRAAKTQEG